MNEDEIDLRELFASLWAGKFVIGVVTALALAGAVVYALGADEEYQSAAVFELKSQQSGPRLPSQYSDLAALAGFGGLGAQSQGVFDRLAGRDFAGRLAADLDLASDPYFNPPWGGTPSQLSQIKAMILGTVKDLTGEDEGAEDGSDAAPNPLDAIFKKYQSSVSVSDTKNGSIEVRVTHEDPRRAARVANAVVARVISELETERRAEQREQLDYLSAELGAALQEADRTKRAVADYALANSLGAQGEFTQRSQVMFNLREELKSTQEMQSAIRDISEMLSGSEALTGDDYALLRQKRPVVDDVDFRRLLGIPEALNAWVWPSARRAEDFAVTLEDRLARLTRSLEELRAEAEAYAEATEILAGLEREAKVAEATYNVLIEQVKAQALMAGYEGETAIVYQSAVPAAEPSAPKKSLIVALGGVLGLFAGSALALLFAMRRGVYHTAASLRDGIAAPLTVAAPRLASAGLGLERALRRAGKLRSAGLTELEVDVAQREGAPVLVSSTGPRVKSLPAALWAAQALGAGHTWDVSGDAQGPVALLVLGERLPSGADFERHAATGLMRAEAQGIEIYMPAAGVSVAQVLAGPTLDMLTATGVGGDAGGGHMRLVVAASFDASAAAARALAPKNPYHLAITRAGRTLRAQVERLRQARAIDANVSVG